MFCPKCGQQNPETGKFCRSCGTDLGNVSNALAAPPAQAQLLTSKGKPVSFEGAITKIFTGFAFLIVALVLGYTGMAGGNAWWFWMLIPAFGSLGSGVAQYLQIRRLESGKPVYSPNATQTLTDPAAAPALPPQQTQFVSPESRYKTGDLVPPSVTDNTTRHLEMDTEGKTMTLPKPD
ncbi:MAG: zinc-ribbon domain-containing protein [Pyrinomonadaceae bacterium]|nr:zinc-ribbon domain-containing protein [Pyrinomonadaceae bacterium]MBP6212694.1 zinc-ribbon domain-containing protein [Pyrinomonadaceae bacterium]